ncbi:MAG: EAL domain-containing protein [Rhodocyclales bacterium GT-UBC]|nr:MAG: EAL domain-containing protein [Rhodocyclales bacterium GT-UBC]
MVHNQAVKGRKFLLFSLGAIALVWSVTGYALLGEPLPEVLPSLNPGGERSVALPVFFAGLFSILALAAIVLVRRALRQAEAQLDLHRQLVAHTSEPIMITDATQRILAVNGAFELATGYSAAELIGQTPSLLNSGRHSPAFFQAMKQSLLGSGAWEGEIWNRAKNGEISPRQLRIKALGDIRRPSHYVALFTDTRAQKAQEARIEYLAHHDPLTGLPNRVALGSHFDAALDSARRQGSRLGVVVIDLDNFKTVNDSLGHHAGDLLLCEIARRLQHILVDGEHLIRLGGDEFVLLVENIHQVEAVIVRVQAIMRTISAVCEVDGHQLHTSPSIGISFFPEDGECPETLMRNADTAMYYAKSNGRNNYQFFAAPMNVAATKRLHLESELWQALSDNQLLLHYQPQIELPSGRIVGVEALVRWQHPQRGMISPVDFIPVAEETGLILPLGHWVLLTACRQARAWLDQGVDLGEIAVNISAQQFKQPEFAKSVHSVLVETGLPAERLELEITESTVMNGADSSVSTLLELKAMGVKLAIDDFGTGYSSLSYLRRFPLDRLKIDRTFVADLESDADAASLVGSIIALGRSLGLRLVAEGVENSAQVDSLRSMDCERVQGFHFCRPVPAEDVVAACENLRQTVKSA